MKIKNLIIGAACMSVFFACKKDNDAPPSIGGIVGKWTPTLVTVTLTTGPISKTDTIMHSFPVGDYYNVLSKDTIIKVHGDMIDTLFYKVDGSKLLTAKNLAFTSEPDTFQIEVATDKAFEISQSESQTVQGIQVTYKETQKFKK
jgi:hypothetical protein